MTNAPPKTPAKPVFSLSQQRLKQSGRVVLSIDRLEILPGEKVALLGHSGVGKSTLLDVLYAQCPKDVAWCPQQLGLIEPLSVYHNVYAGRLSRYPLWYNLANLLRPWPGRQHEVTELLTPLRLTEKLTSKIHQLSGGQRQRTALARALYQQRPTFLGDEPTTGVDPVQSLTLLAHVLNAHTTAVVALHDAELALACCTRIIGLKAGSILFDKPSQQVSSTDLERLYQC
ncbi:ATP-binding cassette domain-containing protein [Ferrimonas pelagia]|uniref:ATP-binding cassette domain-containing protein n=1 Tax=Ferrimonas pelagia TaxID=1177826 RepID=UPI0031F0DAF7